MKSMLKMFMQFLLCINFRVLHVANAFDHRQSVCHRSVEGHMVGQRSDTDRRSIGNFGTAFGSGNFIANGDGSYTALGSGGISYKILSEAAPRYPRAARSIGFNKVVRVRVKFLVGLDGQVETTEIITRNIPDLGFKEAAVEAVKKMKFAPIYHQGRNIKVYFQKTIVFQP